MNDARVVLDAPPPPPPPPWMLLESTGDSETDAGIRHARDCDNDDDDDAQSCICDESGDFDPDSLTDLRFRSVDEDPKDEIAQPQKGEEEVRGFWRNCGGGGGDEGQILCHKSSASIDSTEEENNKLFWEACLAS